MPEDDNETHLRTFKSNSDVVEHYQGNLYEDKALIKYEKKEDIAHNRSHTEEQILDIVTEKMMGTALLGYEQVRFLDDGYQGPVQILYQRIPQDFGIWP